MKNLRLGALLVILSCDAMAGTSFCVDAIGNSLQSINTSPGNCEAADMIFTMFQASGGSGSGTSFNPGLSLLDLAEVSGSLAIVAPPPVLSDTSIEVAPGPGAAWGSGGSGSSSVGYLASLDPTYTPQPNAPYSNWTLSDVTLGLVEGITGNFQAGDSLTVTESFCLGGGAGSLPGCSGAGQILGSISITATATSSSTVTYSDHCTFGTCSATNSDLATLTLPAADLLYQSIAIQNQITASSASGSITVPNILNNFDQVGVGEVPETSTFVMIGSAMLAIGCLRHRRIRKRLLNQSINS